MKNDNKTFFSLLHLCFPIILNQFLVTAAGFVTTIFLARLGTIALATTGLVYSGYISLYLFCIGCLYAVTIPAGRAYGKRQLEVFKKNIAAGLLLAVFLGCAAYVALFFLPHIYNLSLQDMRIIVAAKKYLAVLSLVLFPYLILVVMRQFFLIISRTRIIHIFAVINFMGIIAFSYIFIFGVAGYFQWGIVGAALSSLVVAWICLVFYLIFCFRDAYSKELHFFHYFWPIPWREVYNIFLLGWPIGLGMIIELSAIAVLVLMLGHIGDAALASYQVIIKLDILPLMIPIGVAQATTILMSRHIGAGDYKNIPAIMRSAVCLSVVPMICFSVCYVVFSQPILAMFFNQGQYGSYMATKILATHMLYITAIYLVFDSIRMTLNGSLRALQDVKIPMLISFFCFWVIGITLSYILGFYTDLAAIGVWLGLACAALLSCFCILWRVRWHFKHGQLTNDDVLFVVS